MDRKEQLKFVLLVMSMTSCIAYSYGAFSPLQSFRNSPPTRQVQQSKDHRNDGGTEVRTGHTLKVIRNSQQSLGRGE